MKVAALTIGGATEAWRALGFRLDDAGVALLGSVRVEISRSATPGVIESWAFDEPDVPQTIDGLKTLSAVRGGGSSEHANGAIAIDHVVVLTPSLERTTAALAEIGAECRRVRDAGREVRQGFFLVDDLLVEVVERAGTPAPEPARFWGLTIEVSDLEAAASMLGDSVGLVKDAVQPGRRIATVEPEASGGLPLALISRRQRS